jgi:HEAT repeat protein
MAGSDLGAQAVPVRAPAPTPVQEGPSVGRREQDSPLNNPLDDRLLPDAARSPWRTWFSRNYSRFEPPPLAGGSGRGSLPPHLVDPVLRERRRALYREDVATRLKLLLRDGDDRVRGAAAVALARTDFLDDSGALAALFELHGDDHKRVREQALLAVGLAQPGAARHRLLSALLALAPGGQAGAVAREMHAQNDVERTRVRALAALFLSLQGEPLLPALVGDLARDPRAPLQLRALVVQALGLSGAEDAAAQLTSLLDETEQPPLIRATAVAALGLMDRAEATPRLLEALVQRDCDTDVRAAAALALGACGTPGDDVLVRELARATDREGNALVNRFILLAMGEIGGATARLKLEHALEHESAEQRVFAELALGLVARRSDGELEIETLVSALRRSRSQDEQCALLCALGISGKAAAYEAVASRVADNAPEVRRAAMAALSLLRQPGAVALIEQRLIDDPSPDVRIHAARALARLDPTCASLLVRELGSSKTRSANERAALLLALGHTGDPVALEPLLDLLREPTRGTREREAATHALGLIYDLRRPPLITRLGAERSFLHESTEMPTLLALME